MPTESQAQPALRSNGSGSRSKRLGLRLGLRGAAPRRPALENLVIIGNGPAGFRLCERLTAEPSARFHITALGEEPRPAYDRVRLTEILSGAPETSLQFAPASWYRENGIQLRTGDPAVAVDLSLRQAQTVSGEAIPFDRLVFATGSRAHLPEIPGAQLPGVFVYRTIEDLRRIAQHVTRGGRAAVIGGGLLGLEAAVALRPLGLDPWIVERGTSVLARQLDPEAGQLLGDQLGTLHVRVLTGRQTERIDPLDGDLLLQFTTGEALRVQSVIFATGIRPRDELAAACGLKLGPRGGILVNDRLEASAPGIYAIGECASHRGVVFGLAAPAYQMAEILADNLAGRHRRFEGADVSAWLKAANLSVAALGQHQADVETLTWRSASGYRRVLIDGGRLAGAVGVGDWPEQRQIHAAIVQGRRVWRWQRARFVRSGHLWRARAPQPVVQWPPQSIVCACRGVTRGALSAACAQGCVTTAQLARATGASTVCGSCAPYLAELVGAPSAPPSLKGATRLLGASAAALILALVIALAPPLAFSDSAQTPGLAEFLWGNSGVRQVTGFVALGLILLGLALSARKRLRRFSVGTVDFWKFIHSVLGVATLVAVVSHTGFRLGAHLNRVLMLNFLALAGVGALAGAVTALEHRIGGPLGRRVRAAWSAAHLALAWPLPVLLIFHILTAYYF